MAQRLSVDDVDLFDLDLFEFGDPHAIWTRLRREAPMYKHTQSSGEDFWSVTTYANARRVLDDPDTFSSARGITLRPRMADGSSYGAVDDDVDNPEPVMNTFILNDPPRHGKRRATLNKQFTPRNVRKWEEMLRRISKDVFDEIADKGECDFVYDVAHKIPARMTLWLLGVPEKDLDLITEIEHRMLHSEDEALNSEVTDEQRQMQTQMELAMYFAPMIEERKKNPEGDLISQLLQSKVDGQNLSDFEVQADIGLFIAGGLDTTRAAASGGAMLPLLQNPDQFKLLRENPGMLPTAVDEFVRWASPIVHVARTAKADAEVGGHTVKKGERVAVWLASANRDESIIPDPFRYDLTRNPNDHLGWGNDHLGFGHGEHFCIGANLARLTLQIEFEEVLSRFKSIELAGEPRRVRSHFVGGLQKLPIRFEVK